ncbi:hypothetical protein [Nocardia tengchongensis]|uniref:hypothetical protein n=1 Tax=Nocardia tengchongensis TaxID=2055889 RepID=UPI00361DEF38
MQPAAAEPATDAAAADFYIPIHAPDRRRGRHRPQRVGVTGAVGPGRPRIIPATSTRIMYVSSDADGAPTAVVGTYLQPTQPWIGPGERPLVADAGGTKGQGKQCAPSKLLSQVVQYQPPVDAIFE